MTTTRGYAPVNGLQMYYEIQGEGGHSSSDTGGSCLYLAFDYRFSC